MCSVKALPASPNVSSDDGWLGLRSQVGEENSETEMLRMVRVDAEVGEQQLFPARMLATAVRFNRDKYGVNIL
jgi:hypothetical protein